MAPHACSLGLPGALCPMIRATHRCQRPSVLHRSTRRARHARPLTPSCSLASPQQHPPGALTEAAASTKVRVERQTHLPASREEAWGALRQLVSREQWRQLSAVFAALESIYRCCCSACMPMVLHGACTYTRKNALIITRLYCVSDMQLCCLMHQPPAVHSMASGSCRTCIHTPQPKHSMEPVACWSYCVKRII